MKRENWEDCIQLWSTIFYIDMQKKRNKKRIAAQRTNTQIACSVEVTPNGRHPSTKKEILPTEQKRKTAALNNLLWCLLD